ncbi:MAG: hypothetical protein J7456_07980, partial [Chloroflexus sp.]|nr:hypothetical protein [Chloroflexus sp.]
ASGPHRKHLGTRASGPHREYLILQKKIRSGRSSAAPVHPETIIRLDSRGTAALYNAITPNI